MNKVVRLSDGRFITRKLVESDPRALAKAKPEEIWTMNDGKSNSGKTQYTRDVLIRDMDTTHIVNALRLQTQQAYSKMKMLNLLQPLSPFASPANPAEAEELHMASPDVVAFALKTMPKFSAMRDELDIRLGRKQRALEPDVEHVGRKFDFT